RPWPAAAGRRRGAAARGAGRRRFEHQAADRRGDRPHDGGGRESVAPPRRDDVEPAERHHEEDVSAPMKRSAVTQAAPDVIATATLTVPTAGEGFVEITREAARFVADVGAGDGALFLHIRHTSASLTIQENADPDVRTDLVTALRRLAPDDAGW